jgi:hypothetical protein
MRYDSMFVFIKIFINPNNKIKLSNFDSLNAYITYNKIY